MSDERPQWRKQLEQSLDELKTLGDQVGQRVGSAAKDAGDEARKAWQELQPRLGEAEARLREATDDAVDELRGMFGDLGRSLHKLKDKL